MTARVEQIATKPPKPTEQDFPEWCDRKLAVKYVKFLGFPNITENSLRYAWKVVGDLPKPKMVRGVAYYRKSDLRAWIDAPRSNPAPPRQSRFSQNRRPSNHAINHGNYMQDNPISHRPYRDGGRVCLSTMESWFATAKEHGEKSTENDWIALV
jgi:hypothetical protein